MQAEAQWSGDGIYQDHLYKRDDHLGVGFLLLLTQNTGRGSWGK